MDAAGDVFVADEAPKVVEVPAGCFNNTNNCQIAVSQVLAYGVAVDAKGDIFLPDRGTDPNSNQVLEINRSLSPSLNFANTNVGSTSADSPLLVTVQNIGTQPLTGSLALDSGREFPWRTRIPIAQARFRWLRAQSAARASASRRKTTGHLRGTAVFTDNALNASSLRKPLPSAASALTTSPHRGRPQRGYADPRRGNDVASPRRVWCWER